MNIPPCILKDCLTMKNNKILSCDNKLILLNHNEKRWCWTFIKQTYRTWPRRRVTGMPNLRDHHGLVPSICFSMAWLPSNILINSTPNYSYLVHNASKKSKMKLFLCFEFNLHCCNQVEFIMLSNKWLIQETKKKKNCFKDFLLCAYSKRE